MQAIKLYPLNDSFVPKHIILADSRPVRVGRQTNASIVPGERNGYFDSKVLSRQHAEIWEEDGRIWIKDTRSSNGTYLNGVRLSPEGVESVPFELTAGDQLEFGIDIVGSDNETIIHYKVAARVECISASNAFGHPQEYYLPQ
ncbi:hypothetical protein FRB91_000451 [Serendipita sp. 411]|nr:hypothetical protein FRC15_000881 [Serendipita sp. 397]KAG8802018.1 hypothetical protein FRC16_010543 [Serendipita sp. 398]KAG8824034.1 hypothetical protein FRC19_002711 [Serendipita sp. 401]KAG8837483.1 hypothetical protein FRC18_009222 [Serendipita sp. 400]KAG8856678.1 hypothetical protein FRB91_000451 [Serendipita sp. 411]KAG8869817.1 hypothetical protein FRC20_000812 [Serendipita sp. 405]KAG9055548.1 hypothetical protein FS842_001904 [Serendipita sp. 407]